MNTLTPIWQRKSSSFHVLSSNVHHDAAQELTVPMSAAKQGRLSDPELTKYVLKIDDALQLGQLRITDVFAVLVGRPVTAPGSKRNSTNHTMGSYVCESSVMGRPSFIVFWSVRPKPMFLPAREQVILHARSGRQAEMCLDA